MLQYYEWREKWFRVIPPAFLLVCVVTSFLLNVFGITPSLAEVVGVFFDSTGLLALPPIVILEYTYGINFVFPGAVTILSAMALAAGRPEKAIIIFFIIWLFSFCGLTASYVAGRKTAQQLSSVPLATVESKSLVRKVVIFFMYGHPLTASIRCYQIGLSNVAIDRLLFELIPSNFCWNVFWGLSAYSVGQHLASGNLFTWLLLAYALWWLVSEASRSRRKSN